MLQLSRVFDALLEDQSSVPRTHKRQLTTTCTSSSRLSLLASMGKLALVYKQINEMTNKNAYTIYTVKYIQLEKVIQSFATTQMNTQDFMIQGTRQIQKEKYHMTLFIVQSNRVDLIAVESRTEARQGFGRKGRGMKQERTLVRGYKVMYVRKMISDSVLHRGKII